MFYCDFCRAAQGWPRSAGWPYMGISEGTCEMCDEHHICHDVPSDRLVGRAGGKKRLTLKECAECLKRRYCDKDDYLCVFCRGDAELPDPYAELAEGGKAAKERVNKIMAETLEKYPWVDPADFLLE